MGKVCVGGVADGRPANSLEDAQFCTGNEGHIVSDGGGGCGMSAFSTSVVRRPLGKGELAVMNSLLLLPIRLVRNSLRGSLLVSGLELINDALADDLARAAATDEALRTLLTDVLFDVASLAGAMLETQSNPDVRDQFYFTEPVYRKIVKLTKMMGEKFPNCIHGDAEWAVVNGLKGLVGKDARAIFDAIRKDIGQEFGNHESDGDSLTKENPEIVFRKPGDVLKDSVTFTSRFPGGLDALVSGGLSAGPIRPKYSFSDAISETGLNGGILILLADRKIEDKSNASGGFGGSSSDTVEIASGQYMRSYRDADIYYSQATGTHFVLGDIRAKYNAIGGAKGVLGLPTTDELGTPDGIGRYNHFQKGSIYWKPNIGPMMLHTALRDLWAAQGWEWGFLGYPILDQHRKVFANPTAQPQAYWEFFENGALFASNYEALPALVAEFTPGELASIVRKFFDDSFHEASSDLGIEGGIKILGVSDYQYDFWSSVPRHITYEIDGFHKNPIVSDTTFNIQLTLEFGLSWPPSFTEPAFKTVTISLIQLHIHTSGIGNGELLDRMRAGILDKFRTPFQMADIPVADSKFIGLQLTKSGGLQFLLEPMLGHPDFTLNRYLFQNELNKLIPS
jgi:hypothetical protein